MRPIVLQKNNKNSASLYEQLYEELKRQILSGDISSGERLPSVRGLSSDLSVSVTTVLNAYNQLVDEGYLINQPGSGYYAVKIANSLSSSYRDNGLESVSPYENFCIENTSYLTDNEVFDFTKWKKCTAKIFNEYSDSLFTKSDLKGEEALRKEISGYLLHSRGVHASYENIVISAGTQMLAFHLGRILKHAGISLVSMEKPGYAPVRSMFSDAGFNILDIPVHKSGIELNKLPVNLPSAVYVNPSNQFPTGAIMPITERQRIIEWANDNGSYVIEDDYDSELRYFGKPLPTLKSLDSNDRVIYLGSFSSTLFEAIKISYMVLPGNLTAIFDANRKSYSQTCSKAEQLTLALFMHEGYYYTAIRKKRALYTAKLNRVTELFEHNNNPDIRLNESRSGLSVIVRIRTNENVTEFLEAGNQLGIRVSYIEEISDANSKSVSLIFNPIPMARLDECITTLLDAWNVILGDGVV